MTVLTAASRKRIPSSQFALPAERKYPIENREHAANAKARAKQQLDAGRLSRAMYDRIIARANAKLREGK